MCCKETALWFRQVASSMSVDCKGSSLQLVFEERDNVRPDRRPASRTSPLGRNLLRFPTFHIAYGMAEGEGRSVSQTDTSSQFLLSMFKHHLGGSEYCYT